MDVNTLSGILLTAASDTSVLFDDAWTTGNLYEIQGIVGVLSTIASWFISVIGFGIIIFSILKNALSGLYVINPQFWDKVDQTKQQLVGYASDGVMSAAGAMAGRSGNQAANKLGGFLTFLLSLIPNIKELTDFANDDTSNPQNLDKKQYFMRSIPLLVFQIFLGVFIFMGYPSKIANWIADAGTWAVDAVIDNVDPVSIIENVSDKLVVYNLSTDGSPNPLDQVVNTASRDMLGIVYTKYSDMNQELVQESAYNIEDFLLNTLSATTDVLDQPEGYDVTVAASFVKNKPNLSNAFSYISNSETAPLVYARATNGTIQYKTWTPAVNVINVDGTTKEAENDYLVWTITATPVAITSTSTASVVFCEKLSSTTTESNGQYMFTLDNITIGKDINMLKGTAGSSTLQVIEASSGSVVATMNCAIGTPDVTADSGSAVLTVPKSSYDSYKASVGSGDCYLKVSLPGKFTYTTGSVDNSTTVKVTELRLSTKNTGLTYGLTTWPDWNNQKISGKSSLTEALKSESAAQAPANNGGNGDQGNGGNGGNGGNQSPDV